MTPSYALGLFFILCVSLIWAAASIVVQHLYRDMDFNSPFLLTYVSTSLFVLWLPFRLVWERRNKWRRAVRRLLAAGAYEAMAVEDSIDGESGGRKEEEDDGITPWRRSEPPTVAVAGASSSAVDGAVPVFRREGPTGSTQDRARSTGGSIEMEQQASYQTPAGKDEGTLQAPGQTMAAGVDGEIENTKAGRSSPAGRTTVPDVGQQGSQSGSFHSDNEESSRQVPSRVATESCSFSEHSLELCPAHEDDKQDETNALTLTSSSSSEIRPVLSPALPRPADRLSHVDHIWMAIRIAPVWFLSNYFYNMSLAYTSITSSTVLASTGSLFTFLFAVSCGDERFTTYKLLGVVLCFAGSVLTGLSDVGGSGDDGGGGDDTIANAQGIERILDASSYSQPTATVEGALSSSGMTDDGLDGGLLWGDLAGLISAIGYGTYTVLIRNLCPKDESRMSMQLLLGYVGTLNGLLLMPLVIKMAVFDDCEEGTGSVGNARPPRSDDEASHSSFGCEHVTWIIILYLVGKALADNVLSDYLWARSVVLTSATVATVGLGLTIPLAFLSDWLMGRAGVTSTQSVFGALSVLLGFLFVNCGEGGDDSVEDEQDAVSVVLVDGGVVS